MFGRSKKKGAKAAKPKKDKKAKPAKKAKAKEPARKAKAPSAPVKKRPTDIYSVMLMLSLGFVALSCVFLALELGTYGFPSELTPWK